MAESSLSEKQWAMSCHLSVLLGYAIPFGNIIAPLIIWSMYKDQYPLVDRQGKESINFQLSLTLYIIVSIILIFVIIGIFLLIALAMLNVVLVIIAAIKVDKGEEFRYPITIRFIQ
jgi:uncharacterized Tic20 family protein